MTDRYYDRDGRPITPEEWGRLHADRVYQRIAATTIEHGAHSYWISTVWLGMDHAFGQGPSEIFETMVFPSWREPMRGLARLLGERGPDLNEEECERYSTEAEARAGHDRIVAKWQKLPLDKQDDSGETSA